MLASYHFNLMWLLYLSLVPLLYQKKKKQKKLNKKNLTIISLVGNVFMIADGLAQVAGVAYIADISKSDVDKTQNFGIFSIPLFFFFFVLFASFFLLRLFLLLPLPFRI
jgi:hypothetical protein